MRKINAIITIIILALLAEHALLGAFNLVGITSVTTQIEAWIMTALIVIHAMIGVYLTYDTIRIEKRAGATYHGNNRLFWARRVSGISIIVFIVIHVMSFYGVSADHYRIPYFGVFRLASSILLILSLGLHIIINIKPLLIGIGVKTERERSVDLMFWFSAILLLAATAFLVYYLRWIAI